MAQTRLANDSNDSGRMKRETPKIQHGIDGLVTAVRQLEQVKQQARALGIFTNDRELLECPSCGLLEDVTIEGEPNGGVSVRLRNKIQDSDGLPSHGGRSSYR